MKRLYLLAILLFCMSISPVLAADVDLTAFPNELADKLGITVFPARILTSLIFTSFFFFPTLFYTRGKNMIAIVFMGLGSFGFCVAIGWFPIWLFTILCLTLALVFSKKIVGLF